MQQSCKRSLLQQLFWLKTSGGGHLLALLIGAMPTLTLAAVSQPFSAALGVAGTSSGSGNTLLSSGGFAIYPLTFSSSRGTFHNGPIPPLLSSTVSSVNLDSSANPAQFNQAVTFTATVTGQNPTGTVAFTADGNTVANCGAVAMTNGGAQCIATDLSGGTHTITATYSGDASNQAGSANLQQVVQNVFTGPIVTGQGNVTVAVGGGGAGCNITQAAYVNPPAQLPAGYTFPYGLLHFTLGPDCDSSAVTIQVTYPAALPADAKYWKYGKTQSDPTAHWYEFPATLSGATATFTLTDGGLGDDDLTINGNITDDSGVGVPASISAPIPTLSEWALGLLAGLLGLFGIRRLRQS